MKKTLCFIASLAAAIALYAALPLGYDTTGIPGNVAPTIPGSSLSYRAGQVSVSSLATSQLVTFSTPMAGTNYSVIATVNGVALVSAVSLTPSSKTTNGFMLNLSVGITGSQVMDYVAWQNN